MDIRYIEPDDQDRELWTDALRRDGYAVVAIETLDHARRDAAALLATCRDDDSWPPALIVLLEVSWPGLSPIEVLKEFVERYRFAPVVVFTHLEDETIRFEAVRLGAGGFLTKDGTGRALTELRSLMAHLDRSYHYRRRHARVRVPNRAPVGLHVSTGERGLASGRLVDVSASGLRADLEGNHGVHPGHDVDVELLFPSPGHPVTTRLRVVEVDGSLIRGEFKELSRSTHRQIIHYILGRLTATPASRS